MENADAQTSPSAALPDGFFSEPPAERDRFVLSLVKRQTDGARGFRAAFREGHGDPAALPALRVIAELDPDEAVKRSALFGLSRIDDPSSIPTLRAALTAPDRASRAHAINGLGRLRAREAVPDLIHTLRHDRYGRAIAAQALATIGDPEAGDALRSAVKKSAPWRRPGLRRALDQLEDRDSSRS
jgi:hypothetical protein